MFEMYSFIHICIQCLQKVLTHNNFLAKKSIWISKTAGFYVDFKFVDAAFKTAPKQVLSKKHLKMGKNGNTQIPILFQP
jgi:hypothetical protein